MYALIWQVYGAFMSSLSLTNGGQPVIISTMKIEGAYIREWLAYHRVTGFSGFLIQTNDCEEGTIETFDRLPKMGLDQHERNEAPRRCPHKSLLNHTFHQALADWENVYVADFEEYLNVKIGHGLVEVG